MNTATLRATTAQNTSEIPQTPNVDFSHRLESFHAKQTPHTLNLAIEAMAFRCVNVLHLVASQFAKPDEGCTISDEVIYFSLNAAIQEVMDIRATVEAFNRINGGAL